MPDYTFGTPKVFFQEDHKNNNNNFNWKYYKNGITLENECAMFSIDASVVPSFSPISHRYIAASDELEIYWGFMQGAEEYDLEWTYINDYDLDGSQLDPTAIAYDFRSNATRISTSQQHYRIPLTYERGYIAYRVRGKGRSFDNVSEVILGRWSSENPSFTGKIGDDPHDFAVGAHEGLKNWQFTTNFAEEGKKKEAISYFDGSLRNRQVVSKLNTEEEAIVGETIYDHQGRGAIQVLPSPAQDGKIRYFDKFNRIDPSTAFTRDDFDKDINSSCGVDPQPMDSTVSGASRYYSR